MAQQAFINHFQPLNAPTTNKYLVGRLLVSWNFVFYFFFFFGKTRQAFFGANVAEVNS